ncbi:hypothetical protein BDV93DRAFT_549191 [Ceratobasidium sp. AG-I]|nr:hypothetical protein BDV93DRAFT_549191 [Ceratobasidium sp. AG-I]
MSSIAPSKTPEEWIEFALMKIWESGRPAPAIEFLEAQDPDLLEFLMTANEDIWSAVHDSICNNSFPLTQAAWRESLSSVLIQRFYLYLNRLPPNLVDRRVDETIRQVLAFVAVVGVLDHITFDQTTEPKRKGDPEEEDPFFTTKKPQKKRRNTTRARQNSIVVDPRLFTAIDFDIPTSPNELAVTEICLFEGLNQLLKELLQFFTDPKIADHAKQLYFKQPLQYIPVKPVLPAEVGPISDTTNASAPEPGAFPHIRPLGAAKYFDDGVGLGSWPVIVSGRAVAHLRQMQKGDSHVFAMVRKKITELSQGFFSDSNQKRLLGLETEVPIYEAKVSRDLRIVYQIDLDTDLEAKVDKQNIVIKLYGVYTHAQLDNRLWASVSQFYINRRGKEYRRRCLYRTTHRAPGQNVTAPAEFPHEEDLELPLEITPAITQSVEGMTEKDFLDLHSLIALEKFIPMSKTLINSILNDSDASHVFHVSAKEKEIIYHQSACFVLGRSGTGKTTSILFKMIGIEKLFEQMEELARPRQVFVTQSRVLAQRVREYYQNLVSAASSTSSHGDEQVQEEEHVLADLDDEDASAFGLPPKYSMLEDKHFPLFLTYDQTNQKWAIYQQLCSLIEADVGLQYRRSTRTKAYAAAEKRFAIQEVEDVKIDLDQEHNEEPSGGGETSPIDTRESVAHARSAAVTFDVFVAAYWPHFDYRLTKGLDPALVYSEFLGVIEGSEFALEAKNGALSREDYAGMSHRKTSFASQRDRIYDLYEIYRKRKQELGGYDAAERTQALISAMNGHLIGKGIDCLYVDEAQDNLLIDIKCKFVDPIIEHVSNENIVLHNLSNNPHGIFMAGDTAQTISAGSSFRFEDLKAFMWRLEEKEEAVRCGKRSAIHPTLFHLAVNYRSHGGIVDCASSVVQLISELFPYSIDRLNKETGLIDGPKPIFFSGWDRGVVRFEQFLRGETDTKIDFGASQVILVRNDAARDTLRAQVGEIGLILTLYESKGLEFDDVLLYNFFEDSVPTASTWRVILHGLNGVNLGPVPRFDEIRHAGICTELKNLYVGLTRARNHCWIWEESDKGEPMKMFWNKQNLITLCGPEDPMPQLGASSSEAEWAKSGRLLFNKGLYPQAIFCFEKANLPRERDIASAYQARKEARLLLSKSVDRQIPRIAFSNAANDFLSCAFRSNGKQQTSCYLRAAECFLQAEEWKSAAEAFFAANEFDRSAKNYRRAGCFSEAVDVVKNFRDKVQKGVADDIIAIARLEFLRKAQYQQATELFHDVEEQLEYMDDFGFDVARIHVLELHERFPDAADVALQEGNIIECVRLLMLSKDNGLIRQAIEHAIHGLWSLLPFASANNAAHQANAASLLSQSLNVDIQTIDERGAQQNSVLSDLVKKAGLFLNYCTGLQKLSRNFQVSERATQRLLGFVPVRNHEDAAEDESNDSVATEYWILSSSCMFEAAQAALPATELTPHALGLTAISASESDLRRRVMSSLLAQLNGEVRKMHSAAIAVRYLRPCLNYGIFGNCTLPDCGRQDVSSIHLSDLDRQTHFNMRVRSHVLLIQAVQTFSPQNWQDEGERRGIKRIWTHKIYETLFPYFPPLGNFLCVDPKLVQVQDLNKALEVLSWWCETRLHELNPFGPAPRYFLSEVLLSLELGYRVQQRVFEGYVMKLHSRDLVRPHELLAPTSNRSMIHDFIDFYGERTERTLQGVLSGVQFIITKSLAIEINVLVQLLESIGREVIMQARTWYFGGPAIRNQPEKLISARSRALDGVLLPRSWALDIVQRPLAMVQVGWETQAYIDVLLQLLVALRYDNPEQSPLYTLNGKLGTILRGIMMVRVRNLIRQSIARSLGGRGAFQINLCLRYVRADSWQDLVLALTDGPLNRGADELVQLSLRSGQIQPRKIPGVRLITYESIKPDLENQLSFVSSHDPSLGAALNPEAKPFAPAPRKPTADADEPAKQPQTTGEGNVGDDANQTTVDGPAGLVTSQVNFRAPALDTVLQRSLAELDISAGLKILFCYRRYRVRQRAQARRAVGIIWAYYTRHYRRRRGLSGGSEDTIRKLHLEYKRGVDSIECPLLLAKMFRHHEMILQGSMPHVLVYLRGLERINQQQRDTTKKRLQKVQHEELERVQAKMATCSTLAKKCRKLYPKVQPGSDTLRRISTLKEKVQEVDELRQEIIGAFGEGSISAALEGHYLLGVRIILAPVHEPTAPKPLRPELNAEDLADRH